VIKTIESQRSKLFDAGPLMFGNQYAFISKICFTNKAFKLSAWLNASFLFPTQLGEFKFEQCLLMISLNTIKTESAKLCEILRIYAPATTAPIAEDDSICCWQCNSNAFKFSKSASAGHNVCTGTPALMHSATTSFCNNCKPVANLSS